MFNADYKRRRENLRRKVGNGLIILPGNNEAPCNYPDNTYKFRQDSTFLYFFGINQPGVAGAIDAESGEEYLFGDDVTMDDIIWMGPQPGMKELATVTASHSASQDLPTFGAPARMCRPCESNESTMKLGGRIGSFISSSPVTVFNLSVFFILILLANLLS